MVLERPSYLRVFFMNSRFDYLQKLTEFYMSGKRTIFIDYISTNRAGMLHCSQIEKCM